MGLADHLVSFQRALSNCPTWRRELDTTMGTCYHLGYHIIFPWRAPPSYPAWVKELGRATGTCSGLADHLHSTLVDMPQLLCMEE